jgi:hypothetical protein
MPRILTRMRYFSNTKQTSRKQARNEKTRVASKKQRVAHHVPPCRDELWGTPARRLFRCLRKRLRAHGALVRQGDPFAHPALASLRHRICLRHPPWPTTRPTQRASHQSNLCAMLAHLCPFIMAARRCFPFGGDAGSTCLMYKTIGTSTAGLVLIKFLTSTVSALSL